MSEVIRSQRGPTATGSARSTQEKVTRSTFVAAFNYIGSGPIKNESALNTSKARNQRWYNRFAALRSALLYVFCLGIILPKADAKTAPPPPAPHHPMEQQTYVLFLSSSDPDLPDDVAMVEQIETRIVDGTSKPVHFCLEYLEPSSSFADTSRQRATASYLLQKYGSETFDLVIAIDEETVTFAETIRAKLFPKAPLLFFLTEPQNNVDWLNNKPGRTGVVRKLNYLSTLQLALQQNPGTSRVIVISGSSDAEKFAARVAREQFRQYESNFEFQYLTDLEFSELEPRLKNAASDSVIVFLDFVTDSRGEQFIPARILPAIAKAANQPIYGTFSSVVGAGAVGGSVAELGEVGQILRNDGVRILKGERAENVPVAIGHFQHCVIDWRQLHHFGISESEIPKEAEVRFWQYSPWEVYAWRILALCTLVLIETLLIILLLRNIANRKRSQEALRRKEEDLAETQLLAALGNWVWDAKNKSITWSKELYRICGLDPSLPPPSYQELSQLVTPASWGQLSAVIEEALQLGSVQELDLELVRSDGSNRWVAARGVAVRDEGGRVTHLRGTAQDVTERKKFVANLQESQDRLEAIVESAMDAIIALDHEQRIVLFNASAEKMFRCTASDAIGGSVDRFIPHRFRAKHLTHIRRFGETDTAGRAMGTLGDLCAVRSNGEEFPIEASISCVENAGGKLFTAIIRDVTERRRVEETMTESETRFRLIANTAPVLIWMSGPDKLCNYFNQPWLDFTGKRLEEQLGVVWGECVHADDQQKCRHTYTQSFDRRENFTMEYRLRRHDGEYRWIMDTGVPKFNNEGSFAGYVGCCVDISDQKAARAVLADFSAHLIQEGEKERARIARELHDDINQRLALLANGLQEVDQNTSRNIDQVQQKKLHELWQLTNEIATDLQHLSHQLHPSKLHYLGLATAVRELCHEFSAQHEIEVECVVRDLPKSLADDNSLGLFRVVQESLHNVLKHSHAGHVKVELTGQSGMVQLRVSDDGVGFNPDDLETKHGLGLISMRERLRSVGGEFSIWSRPSLGTQVEGCVPANEVPKAADFAAD
jgi:PAS domain S-box-containing protein